MLCCCDTAPPPPTGACCEGSTGGVGICNVRTEADCAANNGDYQGDGTDCDPNPCPTTTGACCFPDGSCIETIAARCTALGGDYQGNGTDCDTANCPQPTGACCAPDGTCTPDQTEADCIAAGNVWQGAGTVCVPNPCPIPIGACCETSIPHNCQDLTEAACLAQGPPGDYVWNPDRLCAEVNCECTSVSGFDAVPRRLDITFAVPSLAFNFELFGVSPTAYGNLIDFLNSRVLVPFLTDGNGFCQWSIIRFWEDPSISPTYRLQITVDAFFSTDGVDTWAEVLFSITNDGGGAFSFVQQTDEYWSNPSPNPANLFGQWTLPGNVPPPNAPGVNYTTQSFGNHTFPPQPIVGQGTITYNSQ